MPVVPEKLNKFINHSVEELELLYRQMVARPSPEPWQDRQNLASRMNSMLLSGLALLIKIKLEDPGFQLGYGQHCLFYIRDVGKPLIDKLVPAQGAHDDKPGAELPNQLFIWTGKCGLPMAFIQAKTQDQSRRKLNDLAARKGQTLPEMRLTSMLDLADGVVIFDGRVCTNGTLPTEMYPD